MAWGEAAGVSQGTAPGERPRVAASIVTAFDRLAVTVRPGSDVVARMPGVLLVAGAPDSERSNHALTAALDLLESHAQGRARSSAPQVSRELVTLIEGEGAPIDLALVAATDDALAVVITGSGALSVADPDWRLVCPAGQVLSQELDWPAGPMLVDLGAGQPPAADLDPSAQTPVFDLRSGVVPGAGAVLHPPPVADLSPALPTVVAEPVAEVATQGARVHGYLCRDGHLNDPRVLFCSLCGIRMAESTGVYVEGRRPPLGLLVFDNGASFSLDANYLLGREPDIDERVRAGQLRPLVLFDTSGVISRRHAEIRLENWDAFVLDCGSANGTLVAGRDATHWVALVPGQPIRLTPSMAVRIGERSFVFESSLGAP